MISYLEFEKPVAALEARIAELRETAQSGDIDLASEIRRCLLYTSPSPRD